MAVRTISRDNSNTHAVCVWPKGVKPADILFSDGEAGNSDGTDAALVVEPAEFKAAFGFVPLSGSVAEYELLKVRS